MMVCCGLACWYKARRACVLPPQARRIATRTQTKRRRFPIVTFNDGAGALTCEQLLIAGKGEKASIGGTAPRIALPWFLPKSRRPVFFGRNFDGPTTRAFSAGQRDAYAPNEGCDQEVVGGGDEASGVVVFSRIKHAQVAVD
jgi:hypothetical protein